MKPIKLNPLDINSIAVGIAYGIIIAIAILSYADKIC
jgi:hypothetical protein